MRLTDKAARDGFAVLFDKYGWERDAEAEAEAREAFQVVLDSSEPENGRVAARRRWAKVAARNAARLPGPGATDAPS
jgi:hypothetical protein